MEMCYITFRSVTYAQRGERVLMGAGIGCTLQRTPKWMEQQGCGYCLRLRPEGVHRAVELLRQKNVAFVKEIQFARSMEKPFISMMNFPIC